MNTKFWPLGAAPSGWSRRALILGLMATASAAWSQQPAEAFPSRPIRLIVPMPPGGPSDLTARALAERMGEQLGQSVVIDNRPGASGTLGTAVAHQAPADGYTLVLSTLSSQITGPLIVPKPPFDGVKGFTPIGGFAQMTVVLLGSQSMPVRTYKELVAYARANPGKINYGTPGNGSASHLTTELIKDKSGLQLTHIPYKGGAPMLQALVAGEVQLAIGDLTTSKSWIDSGRVIPLAVLSAKRAPSLPNVPTLIEEGVMDDPADFWFGLSGPAGMPPAVVARLNSALQRSVAQQKLQEFFKSKGVEPAYVGAQELKDLWTMEQKRWSDVIRMKQIRAD